MEIEGTQLQRIVFWYPAQTGSELCLIVARPMKRGPEIQTCQCNTDREEGKESRDACFGAIVVGVYLIEVSENTSRGTPQ